MRRAKPAFGGLGSQRITDERDRCRDVSLHHCHRQSDETNAEETLEGLLAQCIVLLLLTVNATIDFDDEPVRGAVKINDELAEWMLPTKVNAKLPLAKRSPKHRLAPRGLPPHTTSKLDEYKKGGCVVRGHALPSDRSVTSRTQDRAYHP